MGSVGDGEQCAGGVLVEHPGLVDEQHVAGSSRRARGTSGAASVCDQWPSSSHRYPCWWTSQAAENASAPTCCCAAWAALRVGVTTTSRRSDASSRSRAAARVVVFPVPAAPSMTSRLVSLARAATTRCCAGSRWSTPRSPTATVDRLRGACGDGVDEVGLDGEDPLGGQAADVLGDVVAVQQRHAPRLGTLGDVFDQLVPDRAFRDDADGGDESFDLATDVGGVPRRPLRAEPGQHEVGGDVAVDPTDLQTRFSSRAWSGGVKPRSCSSSVPRGDEVGAAAGHDLVRSRVGPRTSVPRLAQPRPGLGAGVLGTPRGLVPVDVAADLRGALAEPSGVRRELLDLAVVVERVPARSQRGPELGVAHHGRVPDPVERLDAVHDTDRVQTTPRPAREDAGVDLHVQVAVRVTGTRGVVPHHSGLELLHRDLHLPATRPDPGGGVLAHPPDHLTSRPIHRRVVRRRDVGVECGGERPGLRPVDHDLDEPQRVGVVAQPPLRRAGLDVVAGDPPFVGVPVERPPVLNCGNTRVPPPPAESWRRTARPPRCPRRGSSRRPASGRPRRRSARRTRSRGRTSPHRASPSSPPVSTRHLALK